MPAGKYTIQIEPGATFELPLQFLDANSVPINLTGYTARMQVRPAPGGTLILDLTTSNGKIVITDAAQGKLKLLVEASETNSVPPGVYRYDLELQSPANVVTRYLEGQVRVKEQITQ